MKIAEINMLHCGSTGRIMFQIADCIRSHGDQVRTFSTPIAAKRPVPLPPAPEGHAYYGSFLGNDIHAVLARLTGKNCCYSRFSTNKLLKELEEFSPDIVHLHNMHASYLNFPMIFEWFSHRNIKVVWTFHDCWPITAKCPHFELEGCERWKTGCFDCPQLRQYPTAYLDITKRMWQMKRDWFAKPETLQIVTPSQWLADLVSQSFLKNRPVSVINNGIDTEVFRPTQNDFRTKNRCDNKFILLGVANSWKTSKGPDVFAELARRLDDSYQIVLVGIEEKLKSTLPNNIITIHKTKNQTELAEIYSAADLFVNPTREDNYPTVNMEAIACGTPVLTFQTGGSAEIISPQTGLAVPKNDIDALERSIREIRANNPFSEAACIERAKQFDRRLKYEEYYELYRTMLSL